MYVNRGRFIKQPKSQTYVDLIFKARFWRLKLVQNLVVIYIFFSLSPSAGILYEAHAAGQELLKHLAKAEEDEETLKQELAQWRNEMLDICRVEQPGSPYYQLAQMMKALQQQQQE